MAGPEYTPSMGDEKVAHKTGRPWAEWFSILDGAGATEWEHATIAKHLATEHGLSAWWAQAVAVEYERARGLRAVGQRRDGDWEVTIQRTVRTAPKKIEQEFRQARRRAAWLEDARLDAALRAGEATFRASVTKVGRVLRWDLDETDEGGRVEVTLSPTGDGRSTVRLAHTRLASTDARDDLKARWTAALDTLRDAHA